MVNNKKFIFVCCGAGNLTSFMARDGIETGLRKRGIKNFKIQHGMISDIPRYESQINILVCSTNYKSEHDFPVLNGLCFVVGDAEGQEALIDEVAGYLDSED